jgi:hypothetical protein
LVTRPKNCSLAEAKKSLFNIGLEMRQIIKLPEGSLKSLAGPGNALGLNNLLNALANSYCVVIGGGLLVDMMKRAAQTKQYAELDHAIKTKVEPYLYNKGQGRLIPISRLVLLRNKERPRHKMVICKAILHKFVKHKHIYFCLSTCFGLPHRSSSGHYKKTLKRTRKEVQL